MNHLASHPSSQTATLSPEARGQVVEILPDGVLTVEILRVGLDQGENPSLLTKLVEFLPPVAFGEIRDLIEDPDLDPGMKAALIERLQPVQLDFAVTAILRRRGLDAAPMLLAGKVMKMPLDEMMHILGSPPALEPHAAKALAMRVSGSDYRRAHDVLSGTAELAA